MNTIVKRIVAVVLGIVVGSFVNITLVNLGPLVVPLPEGADVSSMEGLRESISLFKPANFLFPFLGHALGTLVGAYLAARIATNAEYWFALVIGIFFLMGGITMAITLGGPLWFNVLDIVVAYIPMGLLGGKLAGGHGRASLAPQD